MAVVRNLAPVFMRIGPLTLGFLLSSRRLHAAVCARYAGYLLEKGRPAVTFSCITRPVRMAGGENVSLKRGRTGAWRALRRDFDCTWSGAQGHIALHPSVYAFDACLRVALSTMLPARGALLVHASSVIGRGKAWVFAGPSESGKTTTARLCAPRRVLNDEIVIIGIGRAGLPYVNATPFWGEMGTGPAVRRRYPLEGVHFLVKDTVTRRSVLNLEGAAARFLRCVCLFGADPQITQEALDVSSRIIRSRPVYELHVRKEPLNLETL